jgi:hypothetical protein
LSDLCRHRRLASVKLVANGDHGRRRNGFDGAEPMRFDRRCRIEAAAIDLRVEQLSFRPNVDEFKYPLFGLRVDGFTKFEPDCMPDDRESGDGSRRWVSSATITHSLEFRRLMCQCRSAE